MSPSSIWKSAAIAALLAIAAGPALAEARDPAYAAARATGKVGEKMDGYLGVVGGGTPALRAMVDDLNIKRRAVYSQPYFLRREGGNAVASEFHPAESVTGTKSAFTDAAALYPVIEKYGYVWCWFGNPANAAPGTIRKEFAKSIEANSVHGSDAPETATNEIKFFFRDLDIVG